MATATIIVLVVSGVVLLAALVIGVPKLVYGSIKAPLESRIAAHYTPDQVLMKDLTANSFGLESAGVWQVRGNGALILTREYLHFFMFLPKREVRIPLAAITDITFTRRHLRKATIFDLLKVHFSADGKPDSIAWYLADPTAWKGRIEQLLAAPDARGRR